MCVYSRWNKNARWSSVREIGQSAASKACAHKKTAACRWPQPLLCNRAPPVPFFAGIPNLMAQGGHSQFNFGFVELATLTPTEHIPQPMHVNGSRNIWQSRTPQGASQFTPLKAHV